MKIETKFDIGAKVWVKKTTSFFPFPLNTKKSDEKIMERMVEQTSICNIHFTLTEKKKIVTVYNYNYFGLYFPGRQYYREKEVFETKSECLAHYKKEFLKTIRDKRKMEKKVSRERVDRHMKEHEEIMKLARGK